MKIADYTKGQEDGVRMTLRRVASIIQGKYGPKGTHSGSLGFQGILLGIKSFQTEGDKRRDEILELIEKI